MLAKSYLGCRLAGFLVVPAASCIAQQFLAIFSATLDHRGYVVNVGCTCV